ncbi:protein of uncharacterised function (DUF2721) [Elysia marginata]|uniref:Protein of uncharacterized function (DUF2721) n=1 Tax=Elysia marginata TaxID=1093978 RepID=A0AAV4ERV3_9GAST|nr:protein of uncharacterised function (DUF2721) [Elysia marginata]
MYHPAQAITVELTLTTPALFFPAISLLFLAYTNKYLSLAALVRSLHQSFRENPQRKSLSGQIENLRVRMNYIKQMQQLGIISFILCVVDMFLLFLNMEAAAMVVFGLCLLFLLASLVVCALEIRISGAALDMQLRAME